jgi:copper chaperone CopZ
MSKFLFGILLFFLSLGTSQAQILRAYIGVDGFTCSLCALSVEKSIQSLSFVDHIKMDINKSVAEVEFKKNSAISIHQLAKKVSDAGFSVRYIRAEIVFDSVLMDVKKSIFLNQNEYRFVQVSEQVLIGIRTILFLNKNLQSRKEFVKWERWIKSPVGEKVKSKKVYYVTLFLE